MSSIFQFYEVVTVVSTSDPRHRVAVGLEGAILGMSQDEDSGRWGYAVSLDSISKLWEFYEEELKSTGRHMKRSDFYTDEVIRVLVEPDSGEGKIIPKLQGEDKS